MTGTVLAVVASLAGYLLSGLTQAWLARLNRRATQREEQRKEERAARKEALAAVTGLAAALADHRRAMWKLGNKQLTDAGEQAVEDALAASHVTRSAVTEPLVTVLIVLPRLSQAATTAEQATYAMHHATDLDDLEQRRHAALAASNQLIAQARTLFADLGVSA
jgi:formiminotetrahydrofolate cyclodeaminase